MKILFISATYPTPRLPHQGTYNRTMVEGLRERNEVRVIAPIPWTQTVHSPKSECAQHPIFYYPPKILRPHYHRFFAWSIRCAIQQVRSTFTPDVILSDWLHPDGAASIRFARQMDVPAVVTAGGSDLRLLTKDPARRKAIANACVNADRMIVVNDELVDHALPLGIPLERLDVIARGVDGNVFKPIDRGLARKHCGIDRSARVIVWAGRLEEVKRPHLLLEAARVWQKRYGQALRVLIAGDGALRKSLETARNQFGLSENVLLLGNVDQSQLALLYSAADVIALTSSSEGTPNVLLESINCGAKFVATDVGGVSAIATPGIDRVVPSGNCTDFVEAVCASLEQPDADQTILAKRRFIPYDHRAMCRAIECSLQRAIERPKTASAHIVPAQWTSEVLL